MSDSYTYRPFIYRADEGNETLIQVFVGDELDEDGIPQLMVRLATRDRRWDTWSPPIYFVQAP